MPEKEQKYKVLYLTEMHHKISGRFDDIIHLLDVLRCDAEKICLDAIDDLSKITENKEEA